MDDKQFEELLGKAFEIEQYNIASREPSSKELFEAAPFTDKQLEDIRKMCQKDKKIPWTKYVSRAAAIVLCVVIVGFALMMTDPGIRATVSENIAKFVDGYVNIDFSESTKEQSIDITKTKIGYLPKDFELKEDLCDDEKLSYVYTDSTDNYLTDSTDNYLFIDIVKSGEIFISYERDENNVVYVKINGYDGYLSYDEITSQGSICWGNSNFTVVISGFISREELLKTAENIVVAK